MKRTQVTLDPIVSLAITLEASPGVFALLIGSGLSSAAQIPTGRDITLDLIRKVAATMKVDCEPNPADWYQSQAGVVPSDDSIDRLKESHQADFSLADSKRECLLVNSIDKKAISVILIDQ